MQNDIHRTMYTINHRMGARHRKFSLAAHSSVNRPINHPPLIVSCFRRRGDLLECSLRYTLFFLGQATTGSTSASE